MNPETDIIVSLHATRQYPAETFFTTCIAHLKERTHNYRLILVDDGCDTQASAVVEAIARHEECLLVKTHRQRWFTRAYNLGLRLVRTPWAVLLNADTELGDGWLEELYSVAAEYSSQTGRTAGIVGSVYSAEEPRRWQESVGQDYVTAHCWLVSMQCMSDISVNRGMPGWYLDETRQDAIHIRSDVFGCWDANRAGYGTIKSFKSAVGHHGGKSWGHNLAAIGGLTLQGVGEKYNP